MFYLSDDDRFMIKTIRGEEVALLLALLPSYHAHCRANPNTLLTRFHGLHRVKPASGSTVSILLCACACCVPVTLLHDLSYLVHQRPWPAAKPSLDWTGATCACTSTSSLCVPL